MRLLYWTDLFWPYIGGVEVLSRQLLPALAARGYDVAVVTSRGDMDLSDRDEYDGIPIFRFPFRKVLRERDPAQILSLRRSVDSLKDRLQPDLTHVNLSGPAGFFHMSGARPVASPWVVATHSAIPTGPGADTLRTKLLGGAEWVTSNSEATLALAKRMAPEIQARCSVIYNFVEEPDLAPTPLSLRPPHLLCLGRLLPEKGFDIALEAVQGLAKRFPDLRLTIAGDGPARAALERQARRLGITRVVEFVGWTSPDGVPGLINRASGLIVPSRCEEGFGLVAVEAALMNRPVLASRVGGLPEVVLDHETGLTVPKDDPQALETALCWLIEHPEEARAYGEAGRARALRCYARDRYVQEYDSLYRRVLSQATG